VALEVAYASVTGHGHFEIKNLSKYSRRPLDCLVRYSGG